MQDPLPENIDGSKVVTHSVEHSIDWGHVSIGVGLMALAFVTWRLFEGGDGDGDDETPTNAPANAPT
jgi:hypothetical protein